MNNKLTLLEKDITNEFSMVKNYIDVLNIGINDNGSDRTKILCFLGSNNEGPYKIYIKASSLMDHFNELSRAEVC